MSGFLGEMAAASQCRVAQARRTEPQQALERRIAQLPPAPRLRLERFDVIAEVKRRSPAAGALGRADEDLAQRIAAYAAGGACAVSVLTEPQRFAGTLADLESAALALAPLGVPALRKDFLVDPYQVFEARAAGAGGVLLIVRLLADGELESLLAAARELGLFVLLEAFDAADAARLRRLVEAHAHRQVLLAGLNCRDLDTLAVVPARLLEGLPHLPRGVPRVAESGLEQPEDARRLAAAGYELALVGGALMRSANARQLTAALIGAGRGTR